MTTYPIDDMLHRIEVAVRPFPKAAMFELTDMGYNSIFQQLIACMISIRTYDEVSLPVAIALLNQAPTPAEMLNLSAKEIDNLIRRSSFHEAKARQIREIARIAVEEHSGVLPADFDVLTSFPGVGPKCANLAIGVVTGGGGISVDIHVHRVTNRWGLIVEPTPEKTMPALQKVVPERRWVDVNRLLVPFGKHICTGRLPQCSTCPVAQECRRVGVTKHR